MNTTKLRHIKPVLGGALLCLAALATNAYAQASQPVLSSNQIKEQYDAEMKRCDALRGNEEDVCEKQAKANRDTALANAKQGKKSSEAAREAMEEKRDAQYEVEKEKCESLSGDAQDQCENNAKTKYGK